MTDPQLLTQINDAIGAHGAWKMRLRTAISTGQSDITARAAGCDDACKFGQWLYGSAISPATKTGMPYQVVKRLHADFHRAAGGVMERALAGDKATATALMENEFSARSEVLVKALTKWKREVT